MQKSWVKSGKNRRVGSPPSASDPQLFATPTPEASRALPLDHDVSRQQQERSPSKANAATTLDAQHLRRTDAHQTAIRQISTGHISCERSPATRAAASQRSCAACVCIKRRCIKRRAVVQPSMLEVAGTNECALCCPALADTCTGIPQVCRHRIPRRSFEQSRFTEWRSSIPPSSAARHA